MSSVKPISYVCVVFSYSIPSVNCVPNKDNKPALGSVPKESLCIHRFNAIIFYRTKIGMLKTRYRNLKTAEDVDSDPATMGLN